MTDARASHINAKQGTIRALHCYVTFRVESEKKIMAASLSSSHALRAVFDLGTDYPTTLAYNGIF
jgi:hypothetical protein